MSKESNQKNSFIRALVQARMSSKRFPGKVLAPFQGQPIVMHLIKRLAEVLPKDHLVVATSNQASDDPLVYYVQQMEVSTYRGDLKNVFRRFQECLAQYPCEWFFRICADSPLLESSLLNKMIKLSKIHPEVDMVSNILKKTFPPGKNLELIKTKSFLSIQEENLSEEEKEHITRYLYNNLDRFKIANIESEKEISDDEKYSIDTVEDLLRLETMDYGK